MDGDTRDQSGHRLSAAPEALDEPTTSLLRKILHDLIDLVGGRE